MTIEYAIDELKVSQFIAKGIDDNISEEALSLAIVALKKQIPKKVIERIGEMASCAACGSTVFDIEKYCPHCGQAIDWGDSK